MRYAVTLSLVLLSACDSNDMGAQGPSTETDADTEASGETGDGAESEGGSPADGASSETGGVPPDPDLCDAPDPAADGTFDVAFGDWELDPDEAMVEAECTVASVAMIESTILTTLQCADPQGASHSVDVQVAAASSGTPAWAAGDEVTLAAWASNFVGGALPGGIRGAYEVARFSMRRTDDGALLATAGEGSAGDFAPLQFEVTDTEICGTDDPDDPCGTHRPLAFGIVEPGGGRLDLLGGQRGVLPLLDGSSLHVDAPIAHVASDCHSSTDYRVVSRRMIP